MTLLQEKFARKMMDKYDVWESHAAETALLEDLSRYSRTNPGLAFAVHELARLCNDLGLATSLHASIPCGSSATTPPRVSRNAAATRCCPSPTRIVTSLSLRSVLTSLTPIPRLRQASPFS